MYVCIINQSARFSCTRIFRPKQKRSFGLFTPYQDDNAVVASMYLTWYWIADLCNREGIPFVHGHAL